MEVATCFDISTQVNHSNCLAEAMAHVRGILTLQLPELKVRGTLKVEDLHLPTRSFSNAPEQGRI